MKLQSTVGIVSTGPVVVCENVDATPYVQSQATMGPGAVDVLPLNVQLSVLPALVSVHVSVSVSPVTPKLAVATVGGVTEIAADADAPPYDPVIVLAIVPPTVLVRTKNVALDDPAGTVTLAGTVSGSPPDNTTRAPPAGAAAVRVAVPVTDDPPATLDVDNEIEASAARAVTVSAGD